MAIWRIQKRYGRGIGRVVLHALPYRSDLASLSLVDGMRIAGPEMFRAARAAIAVVALLTLAVGLTLGRNRQDVSDTQIIVFREAEKIPQPVAKPPPPVEALPKLEPPAPLIAEVKPPPPTPIEVVPEPPPVVIAKPLPPPPPPEIVRPEPPPPAPERSRPSIELAALAPAPVPASLEPAPRRQSTRQRLDTPTRRADLAPAPIIPNSVVPTLQPTSRPTRTRETIATARAPRAPRPELAPAAALPQAELEKAAPTTRSQRPQFAAARTKPRAGLELAPVPSSPAPVRAQPVAPRRTARSGPAPGATNRRSQPRLEPTAGPTAVAVLAESSEPRALRSQRTASAPAKQSRGAPRIALAPAALARHAPSESAQPAPVLRRSEVATERPQTAVHSQAGDLRGVPLGDLASCVTDREEALLKQRVLAAVTNRRKCVSSTGTYRFVETKNLNSFLMWIERAPGRTASDRCVELNNALACLESTP